MLCRNYVDHFDRSEIDVGSTWFCPANRRIIDVDVDSTSIRWTISHWIRRRHNCTTCTSVTCQCNKHCRGGRLHRAALGGPFASRGRQSRAQSWVAMKVGKGKTQLLDRAASPCILGNPVCTRVQLLPAIRLTWSLPNNVVLVSYSLSTSLATVRSQITLSSRLD